MILICFKFSFVGAGQLLPFIIALRAQRVFTNVMALSTFFISTT
ncbi:MAG TPA: hypothetical protein VJC21_05330 [Candidatus Nanoarchaeia archaeon]|nr:hypothetical protein [Candidatus Nanoarchaeia archaeon]